jgi:hypothetical protein
LSGVACPKLIEAGHLFMPMYGLYFVPDDTRNDQINETLLPQRRSDYYYFDRSSTNLSGVDTSCRATNDGGWVTSKFQDQ